MKSHLSSRLLPAMACAGLIAIWPSPGIARGHSTTVVGARGGTYHRQVSRTPGHSASSRAITLPNGQTSNRSLNTQKTDTGRTTSATATGFNGKTATYNSTRTTTADGYTRQVNATGPNGATASKQVNVSPQSGTVTRTVTASKTSPKS